MRKQILTLGLTVLAIGFVNAQESEKKADRLPKEIKFGGRIMYDMAAWNTTTGNAVSEMTGVEFRRVRFYNSGEMYEKVKYKLQLDFSGGEISYKDVWIELGGLPMNGSLRVGHFKEPLRLEALTSSKYITFMERALPIAFSPERNTGVMFHANVNTISMQAGVFREGDDFGNDKTSKNNVNATGRITCLAINEGDRLLHIGAAMSRRKNSDGTYGFSLRAENHLGTKLLETDFSNVEEANIKGLEMAYVNGSFSIQGEYVTTTISANNEYGLNGYYGQISYFITGESRPYKNSYSGFNRVAPKKNFGSDSRGAIELVARISQMDCSESMNGVLKDKTVGLNWYLNPNTRIMFNYVIGGFTERDGTDEVTTNENTLQVRIQVDF